MQENRLHRGSDYEETKIHKGTSIGAGNRVYAGGGKNARGNRRTLRSRTNRLKPIQQSAKSGNSANRLNGRGRYFKILGETAEVVEPGQSALNNPTFGQDLPLRLDAH